MASTAFVLDLEKIRDNARNNLQDGAVTTGYSLNNDNVIDMLNEALATEIICALRYKQHYFMCDGLNAQAVAEEFLEHANEEQSHADQLAQRITQLGGEPNMNPSDMCKRAHSKYTPAASIDQMIEENLVAERIAIDSYRAMINYVADRDPTTRKLLEEILVTEEEHADDLSGLLHC